MNGPSRTTLLLMILCATTSCATPIGVFPMDRATVRRLLSADAVSANSPSIASRHVTLRQGLADDWQVDPEGMLAELHAGTLTEWELNGETTADRLFALAEYSYLHATKLKSA